MVSNFAELDYRETPIGALSLRRRRDLRLGVDIIEIKLGDDFLMSSLFTASEIALARLGLADLAAAETVLGGDDVENGYQPAGFDVVVGGLGLGYTAREVLEHDTIASLIVVDALEAVIDWHESGLLPLGPGLCADDRCRFVRGDFFELSASQSGFDPAHVGRLFDAILVDIDHSPDMLLDEANASFYLREGLAKLAGHLRPGGVFGLWSNETPDAAFTGLLGEVFQEARAEAVTFPNPLQGKDFTQTVYLARTAS